MPAGALVIISGSLLVAGEFVFRSGTLLMAGGLVTALVAPLSLLVLELVAGASVALPGVF